MGRRMTEVHDRRETEEMPSNSVSLYRSCVFSSCRLDSKTILSLRPPCARQPRLLAEDCSAPSRLSWARPSTRWSLADASSSAGGLAIRRCPSAAAKKKIIKRTGQERLRINSSIGCLKWRGAHSFWSMDAKQIAFLQSQKQGEKQPNFCTNLEREITLFNCISSVLGKVKTCKWECCLQVSPAKL